jgi:hypothetical protein
VALRVGRNEFLHLDDSRHHFDLFERNNFAVTGAHLDQTGSHNNVSQEHRGLTCGSWDHAKKMGTGNEQYHPGVHVFS